MKSGEKKMLVSHQTTSDNRSSYVSASNTNLIMIVLVRMSFATALEQALDEDVTSRADRAAGDK